ncbi:hypothetical protein C8R43DRAFT_870113, partial [Mycena crocata]
KIVMKVPKSPTVILPLWRDTCLDMNLKPVLIPRDVSTRWNSTHDMLKIALQYREVVDVIVDHKKAGLRKFELQDEEWDSLSDLFKLYKDLTLKFSLEGIATIAHVLPCMDKIVNMLEDAADDPDINIAVVAALQGGVDLMNKYYENRTTLTPTGSEWVSTRLPCLCSNFT